MRFCGYCGCPQLNGGSPVAPCPPHTPTRKRRVIMEDDASDEDDNSEPIIPVTLSPPGKRRHVKVPWLKEEVLWVRQWVSQNPAAPDTSGRYTFRWSRCALEGKDILQPAHRKGTHVRSCYRSLLQGSYTKLLAQDAQEPQE